jgi:hypothetical protein
MLIILLPDNTPDHAANEGPQIATVAIVFTSLSLAVLVVRFYVRGWMIKTIAAGMLLSSPSLFIHS